MAATSKGRERERKAGKGKEGRKGREEGEGEKLAPNHYNKSTPLCETCYNALQIIVNFT